MIILARLLSPEIFGEIAVTMAIIGLTSSFIDSGFSQALIQRNDITQSHYSSVFVYNIVMSLVLVLFYYTFIETIPILLITFVLSALAITQRTILTRCLRFDKIFIVNIISTTIGSLLGIFLATKGYGLWSLVGMILSMDLSKSILYWTYSDWRPTRPSYSRLRELIPYSYKMMISGTIHSMVSKLPTISIDALYGAATLGLVRRAQSFEGLISNYSSELIKPILFTKLSRLQFEEGFNALVYKVSAAVILITVAFSAILYYVADDLIIFLLTDKWSGVIEYLKILILAGVFIPITNIMGVVISAKGNASAFLRLEIVKKSLLLINISLLLYSIEAFLYGLIVVNYINLIYASSLAHKEMNKAGVGELA